VITFELRATRKRARARNVRPYDGIEISVFDAGPAVVKIGDLSGPGQYRMYFGGFYEVFSPSFGLSVWFGSCCLIPGLYEVIARRVGFGLLCLVAFCRVLPGPCCSPVFRSAIFRLFVINLYLDSLYPLYRGGIGPNANGCGSQALCPNLVFFIITVSTCAVPSSPGQWRGCRAHSKCLFR